MENTTLIAAGDSFIFGNELSDDINGSTFSKLTHPALTADRLKLNYHCVARPGIGNKAIEKNVIEAVEQYRNKNIFVLVSWTYPHRLDIKNRSNNYLTITPHNIMKPEVRFMQWDTMDERRKNLWLEKYEEENKQGLIDFGLSLYNYVHLDDYHNLESLRSYCLVKYYLESKNIPYCFFASTDLCLPNSFNSTDPLVNELKNVAKSAVWLNLDQRGFVQWSKDNNYKFGTSEHPLDQAHYDYAKNLTIPTVVNLMHQKKFKLNTLSPK